MKNKYDSGVANDEFFENGDYDGVKANDDGVYSLVY